MQYQMHTGKYQVVLDPADYDQYIAFKSFSYEDRSAALKFLKVRADKLKRINELEKELDELKKEI